MIDEEYSGIDFSQYCDISDLVRLSDLASRNISYPLKFEFQMSKD